MAKLSTDIKIVKKNTGYPRLFAGFLLLLSIISVASEGHAAEKLKVVTTFTILADMASFVAGDKATVRKISAEHEMPTLYFGTD